MERIDDDKITEPNNLEEALKSDYAEKWRTASEAENESLIENDTIVF